MRGIGTHLLIDLYGVYESLLRDEDRLMGIFAGALEQANLNILDQVSYRFQDGGSGVTGLFLLSESHLAFHSYPEYQYIALDIFSCGSLDPEEVVSVVKHALRPHTHENTVVIRGRRCHRDAEVPTSAAPE